MFTVLTLCVPRWDLVILVVYPNETGFEGPCNLNLSDTAMQILSFWAFFAVVCRAARPILRFHDDRAKHVTGLAFDRGHWHLFYTRYNTACQSEDEWRWSHVSSPNGGSTWQEDDALVLPGREGYSVINGHITPAPQGWMSLSREDSPSGYRLAFYTLNTLSAKTARRVGVEVSSEHVREPRTGAVFFLDKLPYYMGTNAIHYPSPELFLLRMSDISKPPAHLFDGKLAWDKPGTGVDWL